ncbi:MAG: Acetyl esterase Axe7A precursor [Lentisphaerae bacterium ADurb.Bin242]|nr:MAG: Acetyl esterase Axe7A precursor [Lentisphaerae bacterium ADurb.Bin242]
MSARKSFLLFLLLSCGMLLHAAPVTEVKAEYPLKNRKPGENVSFSVKAMENGSLVKDGVLEIEIQENGLCVKKLKLDLASENPKVIAATMQKPGFLTCRTWVYESPEKKETYVYGRDTVPFEPEKLQPAAAAPADFDAFWAKAFKSALDTPPDFRLTPLEKASTKTHKAYLLSFALDGGVRMYGFLSVPADAGQKKYPAVLRIPGAGPGFTAVRHQPGVMTLQMNIHFIDPSDNASFRNEYAKLDSPRPYQTRNIAEPERYYLSRVVPGLCRAADFLAEHPAWNGKSLIAAGSSQGGALSLMTAAFQGKITAVSASIPALCDQNGRLAGRAPGWPNLHGAMQRFEKQLSEADRTRICGYFDTVHFVPKIKVPVNMNCGAMDIVCPPHTVYIAYNLIRAPKEIMIMPAASHSVSPDGSRKNDEFMKKEFAK